MLRSAEVHVWKSEKNEKRGKETKTIRRSIESLC